MNMAAVSKSMLRDSRSDLSTDHRLIEIKIPEKFPPSRRARGTPLYFIFRLHEPAFLTTGRNVGFGFP
jgi:hypothetical protein